MRPTATWKSTKYNQPLTKKLLPFLLYLILPIALFLFYFYPSFSNFTPISSSFSFHTKEKEIGNGVFDSTTVPIKEKENVKTDLNPDQIPAKEKEIENYEILHPSTSLSTQGNISENADLQEEKVVKSPPSCDYTNGGWIQDEKGPLYNGSSCGTIKYAQNCVNNGRPDTDFLFWKWKPTQCDLQRFDPQIIS